MVAINFKKQFIEPIKNGTKTQTCRDKNRFKVGDKLQLYYGMRTKQCKKISDAVCTGVWEVIISSNYVHCLPIRHETDDASEVFSKIINSENFAKADGFENVQDFHDWFLPNGEKLWRGFLIKWELYSE